MPTWSEIANSTPDLAAAVRATFAAHKHHTVATLRRDGSPRISGTEVMFAADDVWLGCMPGSLKARDLQRDPRFALHCASEDPPAWQGDAKLAGHAVEITDDATRTAVLGGGHATGGAHLFRLDVTEMVLTRLGQPADHLVIESWHPQRGVERVERR